MGFLRCGTAVVAVVRALGGGVFRNLDRSGATAFVFLDAVGFGFVGAVGVLGLAAGGGIMPLDASSLAAASP
jgi:hypothetical protein